MRIELYVALAVCGLLAACGGSHSSSSSRSPTVARAPVTTTATPPRPKPPALTSPKPPKPPPPGTLPQTRQRPSTDTQAFHAEMASLWRGIQDDSDRVALPAYFPEGAYLQVKAIADARADYHARLIRDFRLDLAAAHAESGPGAQLMRVEVPQAYVHWVPPGACLNRVGYYEVPNSRLVYRAHGGVRSFGIASMISWRGVWYVVHLGGITRSGIVDDPSSGPGVSAPSSTC